MTDVLSLIAAHRSSRSYSDEPVSDAPLDQILLACQRTPTSANTQHVSVLVVREPATRAKLADLCGGQPWIAKAPVFLLILADQYKTAQALAATGTPHVIQDYVEGTLSVVTDAGILLGQLMLAVQSCGLGCVPIGAIRNEAEQVVDLLKLPPLTFPVVGLCVGHIKTPAAQRPRLPHDTFRFNESYGTPDFSAQFAAYDQQMLAHWRDTGRRDGAAWTTTLASYSDHNYRPHLMAALLRQGYRFDKG